MELLKETPDYSLYVSEGVVGDKTLPTQRHYVIVNSNDNVPSYRGAAYFEALDALMMAQERHCKAEQEWASRPTHMVKGGNVVQLVN